MNHVNLIPKHLRERAAVRRRLFAWSVGASVYASVLLVVGLGIRLAGGQERSRLESDGGRLAERVSHAESQLKALHQQVGDSRQKLDASETVGVHPDWSVLMRALASLRGDDILLRDIGVKSIDTPQPKPDPKQKAKGKTKLVRVETYTLDLKGYGLTQAGVVAFARRIEDLGLMRGVSLKETKAEPHLGVPAVFFELECRLSERPELEAAAPIVPREANP